MAFRQIKSPALANQAVINTKLDVSSVSGQTAAAGVGSLANDTLLFHVASENALKKLSVANLVNSLSTDNLAEGSNLYFTDARAQAAVAADIASAVQAEEDRATAAEGVLTSDLAAEVARATAAEGVNATAIADEESRAIARENAIESGYQTADAALQTQINNIISNVDPAALDSLAEIVAEFQAQDTAISAAVTANANSISAETTARQAADLVLQGNIDNVQAELDATQTGAGLSAAGAYVANTGANYIADATSLNSADVALDSAIKALDTAYKAADTTHSNDIAALEGRMATAEADIDTNTADLATEVARATAAEAANATAIQDEITARGVAVQGAKDYADAQDAALIGDATVDGTAGNTVTDRIATSLASAQSYADTAEADAITSANAYTDARETAITTAYQSYADTAEADAITSANAYTDAREVVLQSNIDAEATARSNADAGLQSQIDSIVSNTDPAALDSLTEIVSAFQAADDSLTGLIGANTTAINNETTRATSAESTLTTNLESEATTRANADTALQTAINDEEAARIAADSAIQAELDATQAGAGLGADGSYTAKADANYIASATSMKNADNLLDAAVKAVDTAYKAADATHTAAIAQNVTDIATNAADIVTNANAISAEQSRAQGAEADLAQANADLQAELDTTQAGAGLAADGSYTANATANYISTATSLKDADNKLDAQAKANADAIATETQDRIDAVAAEASARTTADNALQTNIDNEVTRATTAESNLSDRITANDGDITALQNNLTTETQARVDGDVTLQGKVDTVESSAGLSIDGAYVADTTKTYINDATTLFNADQQLDDAIVAEVARATGAESALDARLTTEEGNVDSLQTFTGEGTVLDTTATDLAGAVNEIKAALGTSEGALAAEVDATQTGAGLGTDGAYTADATANYIDTATSLFNADQLLDTQLKATDARVDAILAGSTEALDQFVEVVDAFQAADGNLNDAITSLADTAGADRTAIRNEFAAADTTLQANIDAEATTARAAELANANAISAEETRATGVEANLQAELDATQTGAGLGTDGAYTANATANYIDTATSLADADNKLDAQAKVNADAIAAEETRATTAEGVLTSDLADEVTRATTAEGVLQGNIDTVSANLAQEVLDRTADVDAEETRALAAEGVLQGNIDAEEAARIAAVSAEASARAAEDTSIRTDFAAGDTAVTTAFQSADTLIQQELDATQTGAGLGTDGAYTANATANYISAATSLKDADNKLDAALKAVDTAYKAADVTLQTNIDAEATRAQGAESTLQDNIDAEATTRATADTALSNRATALETEMTATQSAAGLATDGTYTANGDATYIDTAVSLKDADNKLDAAIAAEVTRATGAESVLTTALSDEVSRATTAEAANATAIQAVADNLAQELLDRAAADTNLQGQIDFIVSNTDAASLDSLTEIVAAFQGADSDLTTLITNNQTAISDEVTRAEAAEASLLAALNTEIANRGTADATLQSNIDGKVAKTGDAMSGNLDMSGNTVTGLAQGSLDSDAVNVAQLNAAISAQDISLYTTSDVAEGTNLYYTDDRARAAISIVDTEGNGDFAYNSATGVITADLSKSYLELTDTDDTSYVSKSGYVSVVNATETGMELVHASELQIFGQTYRQVIDGDGNQTTFALNFLADEASTLVFVGGVIQDPTSHYTVSDADQTITFTAALPLGTQAVIVARELVGASPFIADGSIQADKLDSTVAVGTRSGNTAVSTTGTVVDSFDASTYRSAKYLIQVDGGDGEFETREALVVHNGTVAYITEFAMVYTGDSLLGDASVQMNGTNVELVYTANAAGASVKVISTYIDA